LTLARLNFSSLRIVQVDRNM